MSSLGSYDSKASELCGEPDPRILFGGSWIFFFFFLEQSLSEVLVIKETYIRAVPEIILGGAHFFFRPLHPQDTQGVRAPRPSGHVSALINPPHYGSNMPWPPGQVIPPPPTSQTHCQQNTLPPTGRKSVCAPPRIISGTALTCTLKVASLTYKPELPGSQAPQTVVKLPVDVPCVQISEMACGYCGTGQMRMHAAKDFDIPPVNSWQSDTPASGRVVQKMRETSANMKVTVVLHSLISVSTFVPSETLTKFILLYPEWPPGSAHFPCFNPANQTRSFKMAFSALVLFTSGSRRSISVREDVDSAEKWVKEILQNIDRKVLKLQW